MFKNTFAVIAIILGVLAAFTHSIPMHPMHSDFSSQVASYEENPESDSVIDNIDACFEICSECLSFSKQNNPLLIFFLFNY